MNVDTVKGKILHKLMRAGKIEADHTAIENLQKGFAKDKVGIVKEAIKELAKEGILIQKITSYGMQVSINLDNSEKIKQYIHSYLLSDD